MRNGRLVNFCGSDPDSNQARTLTYFAGAASSEK
jgi:hypothetical protein